MDNMEKMLNEIVNISEKVSLLFREIVYDERIDIRIRKEYAEKFFGIHNIEV